MLLRRIYEDTSLAYMFARINETVSFKGILIRIAGTSDTAKTLALEDIGRIQYIKNGVTIIDADYDFLHAMNWIMRGNPYETFGTAGATDTCIYIPRRFHDNNVETVVPSDNAQIKCTFKAALDVEMASATIQVFLDLEVGVQKYDLAILQYGENIGGAATRPVAFEQPNIAMVALADRPSNTVLTFASSTITELNFAIGEFPPGDFSLGALLCNTNTQLALEANFELAAVPYMAEGDITSRLYDNVRISFTTSGAAYPEILVYSAIFNFDRLVNTSRVQLERVRAVIAAKNRKNQIDTVRVLKRHSVARGKLTPSVMG